MQYLIPLLFFAVMILLLCKKGKPYDSFVRGIRGAPPLLLSLFPYLAAVFLLTELCRASGLTDLMVSLVSPLCTAVGIPAETVPLLLVKPFSGSGGTALLTELLERYGADSYVARCACVCYGSSETVFYIAAVYFAGIRQIRTGKPIAIALVVSFFAAVVGCLLCRIL